MLAFVRFLVPNERPIWQNTVCIGLIWQKFPQLWQLWWRFGVVGSDVGRMKRSYSTPGPVSTGMGDRMGVQLPLQEIYLSLTNYPGQLSLAIPPWVGAMSTGRRAVMLCDWGVKADMMLFAGNTVWFISERVRGVLRGRAIQIDVYFTLRLLWYVTVKHYLPDNAYRVSNYLITFSTCVVSILNPLAD